MATATKKPKASKKKRISKKTTTNLIIIDASGSMESKKEGVKTGLNELLTQVKMDAVKDKKTVKTKTIVIDFSGSKDYNTLVNVADSCELEDNISAGYKTRGSTALYDAIGRGFALVGEKEKNVFVSILTDGEENDSRELDHKQVKELIEKKKKKGWVITFIGTTAEAIENAVSMGISRGNTVSAQMACSADVTSATNIFSKARGAYYTNTLVALDAGLSVNHDSLLQDTQNDLMGVSDFLKQKNDAKGTENKGKLPDNSGGATDSTESTTV